MIGHEHHEEGTAVRKAYQNEEIDTSRPVVSDTVSVTLTELATELHEGLLALAVGYRAAGDGRAHGAGRDRF